MLMRLILVFTLTPLIELALLIELGRQIGTGATLVVVVATGLLGAILAKNEGLGAIRRMREEMAAGRLPAEALLDGAIILTGGLLLLTPGLLTDACGFICLLPPTRGALKNWLRRKIQRKLEFDDVHFSPGK